MATKLTTLLGSDLLRRIILSLLSNSLASATYTNCDCNLRQSFTFSHEDNLHSMHALPATVWLGLHGTVVTWSLQPHYSAINKLLWDHHLQPVAVGELLSNTIRGLEIREECLIAMRAILPLPVLLALSILKADEDFRHTLQ
jgi:hypothetical protein